VEDIGTGDEERSREGAVQPLGIGIEGVFASYSEREELFVHKYGAFGCNREIEVTTSGVSYVLLNGKL
jgi:hypothetical protein